MTYSKNLSPRSTVSLINEIRDKFPPVSADVPGLLEQLVDALYKDHRFYKSMSAEQALSAAAFEAGMREAALQLMLIHRHQNTPKDADGRSDQRSTHRWPPSGARPG